MAVVCSSLVAFPRAASALEVVAHTRLSQPAVGCATAPDVAFWQGDFEVVFSVAPSVCSTATGRSLASARVIPSWPMSVVAGRGPIVSAGLQLFGAVATIDAPVPKLVHAAVARSPGPSTMLHWSSIDAVGASVSGSGTLGTTGEAMVDLAMDCFSGRCTLGTLERSASSHFAGRVLITVDPLFGWSAQMPAMVPAAQRTHVVELGSGPWEILSTGAMSLVSIDPARMMRVAPLTSVSHGAVATRLGAAGMRMFMSVVAGGVPLVQVHDNPVSGSVATFILSETLEVSDADRFVADNARIVAGWTTASPSIRAVIYSESPRGAVTTNAVSVAAMGGLVRSVRVAAGRGAQEGRALIVYESRGGSTDSSVFAVLVQCSAARECDDGDPMTTDLCASQGAGVKRCVHNALSGVDSGVSGLDASQPSDSGVVAADADADAGDASRDVLDELDDVASVPVMDASGSDVALDASAPTDARDALAPRITGGACDCRAAGVGGRARGPAGWAIAAAVFALIGRRGRRSAFPRIQR